jgi:hypothetical protein
MCGDLRAMEGAGDGRAGTRQSGQEGRPEPPGSGGTPVDPVGEGGGDLPAPLGGTRDVTLSLLGHHARECRLTEVAHRGLLDVLHVGLPRSRHPRHRGFTSTNVDVRHHHAHRWASMQGNPR